MDEVMFNLMHSLLNSTKAQIRQLNLQVKDYEALLELMEYKP